MGGESIAYGKNKKIKGNADKINFKNIKYSDFKNSLKIFLSEFNNLFYQKYNEYLWNQKILSKKPHLYCSGSTRHFLNDEINDYDFLNVKQEMGDIDIMVDKNKSELLFEFLNENEDKIIKNFKLLGLANLNLKEHRIISIFQHTIFKFNPQIDFELVEFENDLPTDFYIFSYSSNWNDLKSGFKGVAHKLLLMNLTRSISSNFYNFPNLLNPNDYKQINYKIIKNKNIFNLLNKMEHIPNSEAILIESLNKLKTKYNIKRLNTNKIYSNSKEFTDTNFYAFSVDKGLRLKFSQIIIDEKPLIINDHFYFYYIDSKIANYEKDLNKIFFNLFKFEPTNKDIDLFSSFKGLTLLIKKHTNQETIHTLLNLLLIKSLWGKNTQLIFKNIEDDLNLKSKIFNFLLNNLIQENNKKEFIKKAEELKEEYYNKK
jgi:hypothetical protein